MYVTKTAVLIYI